MRNMTDSLPQFWKSHRNLIVLMLWTNWRSKWKPILIMRRIDFVQFQTSTVLTTRWSTTSSLSSWTTWLHPSTVRPSTGPRTGWLSTSRTLTINTRDVLMDPILVTTLLVLFHEKFKPNSSQICNSNHLSFYLLLIRFVAILILWNFTNIFKLQ